MSGQAVSAFRGMKNQRATEQVEVLLGLPGTEAGTAAGSGERLRNGVAAWLNFTEER